jgi:dihydroorotate dehydrogenase electron transfer subunit
MLEATVSSLQQLSRDLFLISLKLPQNLALLGLGRFARLRAWSLEPASGAPLLDRPFSIHRSSPGQVRFLIKKVGPASSILAGLSPEDKVRLIAPLGRGLDQAAPGLKSEALYLVAGGAGLAPMASVCQWLDRPPRLFYGERDKESQAGKEFLLSMAQDVQSSTQDGRGWGEKGLVTDLLGQALEKERRPIFSCGPPAMMAAVASLARSYEVPFLASVEARMACGLGVCLSCSLPLADGRGQFRACREGPVVDGLSVAWERVPL